MMTAIIFSVHTGMDIPTLSVYFIALLTNIPRGENIKCVGLKNQIKTCFLHYDLSSVDPSEYKHQWITAEDSFFLGGVGKSLGILVIVELWPYEFIFLKIFVPPYTQCRGLA